jgi:hypothetical protein
MDDVLCVHDRSIWITARVAKIEEKKNAENKSFCLCMVLLGLNDIFTDFLCLQISKSHHVCEFADVFEKMCETTKLIIY